MTRTKRERDNARALKIAAKAFDAQPRTKRPALEFLFDKFVITPIRDVRRRTRTEKF